MVDESLDGQKKRGVWNGVRCFALYFSERQKNTVFNIYSRMELGRGYGRRKAKRHVARILKEKGWAKQQAFFPVSCVTAVIVKLERCLLVFCCVIVGCYR